MQWYYWDWKKIGYGMLDVIKVIEEFVDIFFYQVVYMMGIDCIDMMLFQFGYGKLMGIDFNEEYDGLFFSCVWKQWVYKKVWYQGDIIFVGIGQGYWIVIFIQMVKVMVVFINNGKVIVFYLLFNEESGKMVVLYCFLGILVQIVDLVLLYWGLVCQVMYGMVNVFNGMGYKFFYIVFYGIVVKSGMLQVFSLKENQIYNVKMIFICLCDYVFYIVFVLYKNFKVVIVLILENGGSDGVIVVFIM